MTKNLLVAANFNWSLLPKSAKTGSRPFGRAGGCRPALHGPGVRPNGLWAKAGQTQERRHFTDAWAGGWLYNADGHKQRAQNLTPSSNQNCARRSQITATHRFYPGCRWHPGGTMVTNPIKVSQKGAGLAHRRLHDPQGRRAMLWSSFCRLLMGGPCRRQRLLGFRSRLGVGRGGGRQGFTGSRSHHHYTATKIGRQTPNGQIPRSGKIGGQRSLQLMRQTRASRRDSSSIHQDTSRPTST